ncbi:MAG: VWA domain-containing protein [Kofleriaceae bacterium]|nr:VWA domain-containing protein [Kofleriaceae bacterium]
MTAGWKQRLPIALLVWAVVTVSALAVVASLYKEYVPRITVWQVLGRPPAWGVLAGAVLVAASVLRERNVARALMPWGLLFSLGGAIGVWMYRYLDAERAGEKIEWRTPNAWWLLAATGVVAVISFHQYRRRTAAMGFSQTQYVRSRGAIAWLSDLPGVLRVLAIAALVVALVRPETYKTIVHEEDSIDIMIVFDMSKSMEEGDMPRDRMDAAQRVVRRFLRRTKHDRVGLVVFGQQAMLQCPLSQDTKLVEGIVRDLVIGDVPALGTAIGDGLALALAQLRRSDGVCDPSPSATATCEKGFTCSSEGYCVNTDGKKNKVVILLSDGDSNWVTRFEPDEAARTAASMGVKVYTILVGREGSDFLGGMSVNPETLRSIATLTGGEFFRATDYETFDRGFQQVRNKLDKAKRVREERVPHKQLFLPFVVLAMILFGLDLALTHGRLRRLP